MTLYVLLKKGEKYSFLMEINTKKSRKFVVFTKTRYWFDPILTILGAEV